MADVSHIEILDGGYYDIKDENARAANDHQEQLLIELSRTISDADVDNVLSGNQPGGSQRLTLDGLTRFYMGLPKGGGGEGGSYNDGPVQDAIRGLVVGYNQSLATVIPVRPGWDELGSRTKEAGTSIDSRLDAVESDTADLRTDVDGLLDGDNSSSGLTLVGNNITEVVLSDTAKDVCTLQGVDDRPVIVQFTVMATGFLASGADIQGSTTAMGVLVDGGGDIHVSVVGGGKDRNRTFNLIANTTIRFSGASSGTLKAATVGSGYGDLFGIDGPGQADSYNFAIYGVKAFV